MSASFSQPGFKVSALGWVAAILALTGLVPAGAALAQSADSTGTDRGRVNLHIDVSDDNDDDSGISIRINDKSVTSTSDYLRFGESITVRPGEHILGDVASIGGDVVIEGKVTGDCVSIGGNIRIASGADVSGEVVCIGGNLTLEENSHIHRDVVSVWGTLDKSDLAVVDGQVTEVSGFRVPLQFDGLGHGFGYSVWEFFTRAVWVLILIGLGILAFHLFPTRMQRLAETVDQRGLVSFLAGLAGWILWLPVFILLCITVIGIPVAILFLFLTPIMTILGYVAVAKTAGAKRSSAGLSGTVFRGVLILEGALLLGHLFGVFGSIFSFLGLILCIIGSCVIFVAATMGFGGILITRFRPTEGPIIVPTGPPPGSPPPYVPPTPPYAPPTPGYPPGPSGPTHTPPPAGPPPGSRGGGA